MAGPLLTRSQLLCASSLWQNQRERQRVASPPSALPDNRRRLGSSLLSLGLSAVLLTGPAMADGDCVQRCVKECNKIAPGSPEYCQETCADECSFQAAEGAQAEAEGKEKVAGMGFLAEDYGGNSLESALGNLFNWNRVRAPHCSQRSAVFVPLTQPRQAPTLTAPLHRVVIFCRLGPTLPVGECSFMKRKVVAVRWGARRLPPFSFYAHSPLEVVRLGSALPLTKRAHQHSRRAIPMNAILMLMWVIRHLRSHCEP
jgi:hypothetical protein